MEKKKKRPKDIAQLAYQIVQEATQEPQESLQALAKEKNPAAVALGRLGGLKGGPARAKKLSSKRRKEIATKAATTRWVKTSKKD
jgi:methenyltetrahydromethanopterin cyclohydrolase